MVFFFFIYFCFVIGSKGLLKKASRIVIYLWSQTSSFHAARENWLSILWLSIFPPRVTDSPMPSCPKAIWKSQRAIWWPMAGDAISHQQRKANKASSNPSSDSAARVENAWESALSSSFATPVLLLSKREHDSGRLALNRLDFRLIYREDRFASMELARNGRFACTPTHCANVWLSVGRRGCFFSLRVAQWHESLCWRY